MAKYPKWMLTSTLPSKDGWYLVNFSGIEIWSNYSVQPNKFGRKWSLPDHNITAWRTDGPFPWRPYELVE